MTTYKKVCTECGFVSGRHLLVSNEEILSERSLLFLQYTLDKLWPDWTWVVKSYNDEGVFLKWRWSAFGWIWRIKKHTKTADVEKSELYIYHKSQIPIPRDLFFNALVDYYGDKDLRKISKNKYRSKFAKKEFNPEDNIQRETLSHLYQWYAEYGKLLVAWYSSIWERFIEDYIEAGMMATEEEAKYIRDERYIEYDKVSHIIKKTLGRYPVLKKCVWYNKRQIIFN